jgi:hypothetical protein
MTTSERYSSEDDFKIDLMEYIVTQNVVERMETKYIGKNKGGLN